MDDRALRELVVDEFSSEETQRLYAQRARAGLWPSERALVTRFVRCGARVLDLGCGTGRTTFALAALGYRPLGLDLAAAMAATARRVAREDAAAIPLLVGDATALPLGDGSIEAALFSWNGLMQIPSAALRDRALAEVRRVLVPGGVFVFTALRRSLRERAWRRSLVKHVLLRHLGWNVPEREWGDRLFLRPESGRLQFMHFVTHREVRRALRRAGLEPLVAAHSGALGGSGTDGGTFFHVCRRPPL